MSTEHDFTVSSPQYKWLENDLMSVNHEEKWIIFAGHRYFRKRNFTEISRPLYSSADEPSEYPAMEQIRNILEPLLTKYDVDLALVSILTFFSTNF